MSDVKASASCRWFVATVPKRYAEAFAQRCRAQDEHSGDVFRAYIDRYCKSREAADLELITVPENIELTEVKLMLNRRKAATLVTCCGMRKHRVNDLFLYFIRAYLAGESTGEID